MLKVKIEAKAKCKKHPRYDPATECSAGAAIVGGCQGCNLVLSFHQATVMFSRSVRELIEGPTSQASDRFTSAPDGRISASARFRYKDKP